MKTSNYVIELLIAGAGSMLWIFLLAIDFFGDEWVHFDYFFGKGRPDGLFLGVVIVMFPFFHIAGIITDRISDYLFDRLINIKLSSKFFKSKYEYQKAKTLIYFKSEGLKNLYEYGRMRSRICRDWTLNSILILIASNYLIWSGLSIKTSLMKFEVSLFVSFLLLGSTVVSFLTWKSLIMKEYRFVKMHDKILKEIKDAGFQEKNEN